VSTLGRNRTIWRRGDAQLAESQASTSITPFYSRERLDGLVAESMELSPPPSERGLSWVASSMFDGREGTVERAFGLRASQDFADPATSVEDERARQPCQLVLTTGCPFRVSHVRKRPGIVSDEGLGA
jgi:hypothetical protein